MIREKKIALVGAGNYCKELLKDYTKNITSLQIIAIMDNCTNKWGQELAGIPITPLQNLKELGVDEYWICSIAYASELKNDLCSKCGIDEKQIQVISDMNIMLFYRIREKYKDYIEGKKKLHDPEMNEIVEYMKNKLPRMFCYNFVDDYLRREIEVIRDLSCGMLYVMHNQKKLYFSKNYDEEHVKELYNCLCMEQDERSPHKYLNSNFSICNGDVVADIGASEGMFVLDNLEKIKYAYLFEADHDWVNALKKTFESYSEKVQIIEGYVSDAKDGDTVCLDVFFENKELDFIKMDIEGEEVRAIYGAQKILKERKIKAAVCTYHNKDDYATIAECSSGWGYRHTSTRGFLLCIGPWERGNYDLDFRRGVIRLEKNE